MVCRWVQRGRARRVDSGAQIIVGRREALTSIPPSHVSSCVLSGVSSRVSVCISVSTRSGVSESWRSAITKVNGTISRNGVGRDVVGYLKAINAVQTLYFTSLHLRVRGRACQSSPSFTSLHPPLLSLFLHRTQTSRVPQCLVGLTPSEAAAVPFTAGTRRYKPSTMDRPGVQLGSPQPVTPQKRASATASQLLAMFSASPSPSSVTRERRSPVVVVDASLNTPQRTAYLPTTPSSEAGPPMSGARTLRPTQAVTYEISDDSEATSSPYTSSRFLSPETPRPRGGSETTEDEIQVVVPKERSTANHLLRPRSALTPSEKASGNISRTTPQRSRKSNQKNSRKILVSDSQKQTNTRTARNRVRSEIASVTRAKQDSFLLEYKDFFLPLLPEKNYIQKLQNGRSTDVSIKAFVPYETLEEQPKG